MIKNLLFDLGGVIMDIKKDNCVEAFKLLGLQDSSAFFGEYGQKGPFAQIEQGVISIDEFHCQVHQLLPGEVTDEQIDDAFMKFLIGIPSQRLHDLQQLRKKYGIYLLSNTNPIMWDAKIAEDFKQEGLSIEGYFDGIVTSFEAKVMKPDPAIFDYTVQHLGIKAEETMFLDDSQTNLDAAAKLGFATAHVAPGREFMTVLKEMSLA